MKKFDFSNLLENKKVVTAISIFVAVVAWVAVTATVSNEKTVTIYNVPVDFDYGSTLYTNLGINVVQDTEVTVDIVITGPRNVVGGITKEDILVYPQYALVNGAGTYNLSLNAEKLDALADYTITTVRPNTIEVRFDKFVTKKFIIETDLSTVQVAEGYIKGTGYSSPAEVTLSGPEQEINEVSRVVAKVNLQGEQTTSSISTVELELYNKNGDVIQPNHIQFDVQMVEVTVPVLKVKELPMTISFINVPAGFDVASLQYTLSENSILLAGPGEDVDRIEAWEIGYVDLQNFQPGKAYTFEIELPSSYENINNLQEVVVQFSDDNLSTRIISVSDIRVVNAPSDYNIDIQTNRINSVQLVGPKNELSLLSPSGVIAQVNAADITVEKGQQTVQVQFIIPSTDKVFATGTYTVLVNITPKE